MNKFSKCTIFTGYCNINYYDFPPKVNINPVFQPRELEYCFNLVGIQALISDEKLLNMIDYHKVLCDIMPEMAFSKSGMDIVSEKVPKLRHVVLMSEEEKK